MRCFGGVWLPTNRRQIRAHFTVCAKRPLASDHERDEFESQAWAPPRLGMLAQNRPHSYPAEAPGD